MWALQEGLLQQYRAMAISLMGLISAGILVSVSFISGNWENYGELPVYFDKDFPKIVTDLVILMMLIALIYLGFSTSISFRRITLQRGQIVTFVQNLLLAEDSGQLETLCYSYKIPYPIDPIVFLRRQSNSKMEPLAFERELNSEGFNSFLARLLETGGRNSDPETQHNMARNFLSTALFRVFNVFFSLCAIYALFVIIHIFT